MFRIGEFARLNGITVKTLHYYEKVDLLVPAQVDDFTGYRFYAPDQLNKSDSVTLSAPLIFVAVESHH